MLRRAASRSERATGSAVDVLAVEEVNAPILLNHEVASALRGHTLAASAWPEQEGYDAAYVALAEALA